MNLRRNLLVALCAWIGLLAWFPLRTLFRSGPKPPPPVPAEGCDARGFHLEAVNRERKVAELDIGCFRDSTLTAKRLENVKVRLFPRSGAPIDIAAQKGTLIQTGGIALQLEGAVVLDWNGTRLSGDTLFYRDEDDSGELAAARGIRGERGTWRLRGGKALFNLSAGEIRFPDALRLEDSAAGRALDARSGRYFTGARPRLELDAVAVSLPTGVLTTPELVERPEGARTRLEFPLPLTFAGRAGETLAANSGTLLLDGGRIADGELRGGPDPVRFTTPRPATLTAPRVRIAEAVAGELRISALDGAVLESPADPRITRLQAPGIEGIFAGGAPARANFTGGGKGGGPGGQFSAASGEYDFASARYRLAGGAKLERTGDQLEADEVSGVLGGEAVARGRVSGRRGSGEGALRYSGEQVTLQGARASLTGAPAVAIRGGEQIRAARIDLDDATRRHRARGGVELRQSRGAALSSALGESLELDEAAGSGSLEGGVSFQQRDGAGAQFKGRGARAEFQLQDRRIREVTLRSPDGAPVFAESARYRVSGDWIRYRPDEGTGEAVSDPPRRVAVIDLESKQTLYGNRAEITDAGRSIVITSAAGGRTRKDPAR